MSGWVSRAASATSPAESEQPAATAAATRNTAVLSPADRVDFTCSPLLSKRGNLPSLFMVQYVDLRQQEKQRADEDSSGLHDGLSETVREKAGRALLRARCFFRYCAAHRISTCVAPMQERP